ncbi:hypothetical protein OSTOST_21958 [Ostertagia ostertagi]
MFKALQLSGGRVVEVLSSCEFQDIVNKPIEDDEKVMRKLSPGFDHCTCNWWVDLPAIPNKDNKVKFGTTSLEMLPKTDCSSEMHMSEYPFVERAHLNSLQHSISKSDVADTYVFREADRLKQAMDRWEKDGITGVIDHVANITEDSKLWPISRLGRGVLRVRNGLASVAARVLPSMGQDRIEELLHQYSTTMNWKNNWLGRCVAVHLTHRRPSALWQNQQLHLGLQYRSKSNTRTLKHGCLCRTTPFDQRVLAVAANNKILIWRLSVKATNIKPSVRCAQVIELPAAPISQIVWDRTTTNVLLAVSPNSNKIMIVDISTGEVDCFGAWTGGNVTRIVPTNDGRRLAVLYTGNVIRVYDRSTWREERWSGLAGRAVSAVWSPSGDSLVFSSEDSYQIYAISFVAKNEINEDGISEANCYIGGKIHNLTLSPDGPKIGKNPPVVALFIVDWLPTVRFIPSGLVEAPLYGHPSILFFLPKFSNGSLLAIVWSSGSLQYLPMLYGCNTSQFNSRSILDEISGHSSPGHRTTSDSLRSSELPSGCRDRSPNEEIVLFSERFRTSRSTESQRN